MSGVEYKGGSKRRECLGLRIMEERKRRTCLELSIKR